MTALPSRPVTTIDELLAAHNIQQLALDYALAHDSRDLDAMEQLFVPTDLEVDFPRFTGRILLRSLRAYFEVAGPTILFVTNHRLELVEPDSARGTVSCFAQLEVDGRFVQQAIQYRDEYVRNDGVWRFLTREHLLWYGVEEPTNPYRQPKSQWPAEVTGRGSLPEDFDSWRRYYGIAEAPTGHYRGRSTPA
ncbi:nuclear transport factor 2 family protein [Herbiconiux sp. VKM Ac-1786]|uniref:nuclear transport factor 2 family protein n=1 Tax=Herbiconiux sp. VKM Ac-1786 TaxID=2783824 RepID=UPI00188C0378|nr:nuclear transport factor 2 family protein [Herbiconiux sp. VKM Ac-1786]